MCEDCFKTIAKWAKDQSEEAQSLGQEKAAAGLADVVLLAVVSTELNSAVMRNCMLELLTLLMADSKKFELVIGFTHFLIEGLGEEGGTLH